MLQTDKDARSQSARNTAHRYRAYLVRLWQDGPDHPWHASVQSVPSGEVIRFACLETLFDYLEAQTKAEEGQNLGTDTHPLPPSTTGEI